MEIETLNAMNESMYLSLLMAIEVVALIGVFFAIAGFAVYLAGITWLCLEEMRQPARRRVNPAPDPPEPDQYDLLTPLAALDGDMGDRLIGGVSRRAPGLMTGRAAKPLGHR